MNMPQTSPPAPAATGEQGLMIGSAVYRTRYAAQPPTVPDASKPLRERSRPAVSAADHEGDQP